MKHLNEINWNHLYYFFEVSKKLSMKKASHVLGVTVPTISDQIKKLEQELEVRLYDRKARSLALTEDGKALYERVHGIFSKGRKLLDTISDDSTGGYAVTIGVESPILSIVKIDFLMSYWDLYAPYGTATTEGYTSSNDLLRLLLSDLLDWTLSFEPLYHQQIETIKIGSANVVFCCSNEVYSSFINKNDILVEIPLCQFRGSDFFNTLILDKLSEISVSPHEIIKSDQESYLHELLEKGRGVLAMSERLAKSTNWKKKITYFTPEELKISVPVFASYDKSKKGLIAIKNLIKILQAPDASSFQKDPLWQVQVANIH